MLSNELIALGIPLISLILVFLASIGGKNWLLFSLIFINTMTYAVNGINFPAWDIVLNTAVLMYMPMYLATDLLAERYGLSAARQGIWAVAIMGLLVPIMLYLPMHIMPLDYSTANQDGLFSVFNNSIRLSAAVFATVLVAQYFDVWIYDHIHRRTGDKYLWLRNCGSTFLSTGLDTLIFWTIAFYGIFPNLPELMLTAWAVKLSIALLDTPFIYAAKSITPWDLRT